VPRLVALLDATLHRRHASVEVRDQFMDRELLLSGLRLAMGEAE
jgi:hypothetical protein